MTATVEFRLLGYRGTVTVTAQPGDDDAQLIARAKAELERQEGPRPFGFETWRVLDRGTPERRSA